jgi:DNA-binding NarL/FixJ family response regulator
VIISGQDDPAYARRAMQAGAAGFISKSLAVTEAVAAIRRVLAGEVFLSDSKRQPQEQNTACPALTLRELEVLRLLGKGYTNQQIATALEFTERTAKAHIAAIFETLKADNRTQAVVIAQRLGYLPSNGM